MTERQGYTVGKRQSSKKKKKKVLEKLDRYMENNKTGLFSQAQNKYLNGSPATIKLLEENRQYAL